MPFEAAKEEELEAGFAQAAKYEFLQSLIQKVVLVLIAGALLYMVRILIKRSKKMMEELKVPKPIPVAPLFAPPPNMAPEAVRARALEEVGRLEEEISMEGIKKAEMQKKLIDFVHQRPDQATQLVRTWIYEEQGR
jgi:flagellar biosynthesis/type III secretory pathway M-ring protein FliF/YscJ